jgi:hypothetical protein
LRISEKDVETRCPGVGNPSKEYHVAAAFQEAYCEPGRSAVYHLLPWVRDGVEVLKKPFFRCSL